MEILRIPTHYRSQMEYLSDEDRGYILLALMRLSEGEVIEIERSMRGGVVISIWKEACQLEKKARKGKGEEFNEVEPIISYGVPGGCTLRGTPEIHPKSTQINPNQPKSTQPKSNQDSSLEEGEKSLVVSKGNEEINNILEIIKGQVEFLGLIYKKGKYERERAKNILTGKDFGEVCEKSNMSRVEFCKQIIFLSSKMDFWNGKINNAETLYKHYAQVYNEAVRIKSEKQERGVF